MTVHVENPKGSRHKLSELISRCSKVDGEITNVQVYLYIQLQSGYKISKNSTIFNSIKHWDRHLTKDWACSPGKAKKPLLRQFSPSDIPRGSFHLIFLNPVLALPPHDQHDRWEHNLAECH